MKRSPLPFPLPPCLILTCTPERRASEACPDAPPNDERSLGRRHHVAPVVGVAPPRGSALREGGQETAPGEQLGSQRRTRFQESKELGNGSAANEETGTGLGLSSPPPVGRLASVNPHTEPQTQIRPPTWHARAARFAAVSTLRRNALGWACFIDPRYDAKNGRCAHGRETTSAPFSPVVPLLWLVKCRWYGGSGCFKSGTGTCP